MSNNDNLWPGDYDYFRELWNNGPEIKGIVIVNGRGRYKDNPDSEFEHTIGKLTSFFMPSHQDISDVWGNLKNNGISASRTFLEDERLKTKQVPVFDLFRIPDWDDIYKQITSEERETVLTKHFECGIPQYDRGQMSILITSESRYKDYLQYKQKLIGKYTGLSEWLVGFADYLYVKLHNIKNHYGL